MKFLWRIVSFNNPNRVDVVWNGGFEIVLGLLGLYSDESRRAAHAIGLIGATRRVKRILVELGVVPVLAELLGVGDTSTKIIACNALGIVASHIDFLRPVAEAGAIPLYAELLQRTEPIAKEISEDVFCILDEAKAAASDVLWDLSGYKHSVSIARSSGAIPVLIDILRNNNGDVREKVSRAIAQLSDDEVDHGALADAGVIPILVGLLQDELEELKDNAAEALINFSEDPLLRDRMSEAFIRIRATDQHTVTHLR
ncbi:hypothetical protein C5167_023330 [Papaver somniferum]|uniref:Armadillo repeat-containing domain-containing protein n=1 Tax=Papaver somniferum TaxID=3469 RepID=A0A4Y7JNL8_PAPSO|nr:hypothetical protein C5167_023330 [Papaver somniferum]